MRRCLLVLTVLVLTVAPPASASLRDYARTLTLARWHSQAEWSALEQIVRPESGWNPCRYYPSRTDCRYTGTNSCGIPQANPCPAAWRGRLWETRYAQVRWLLDYIERRYVTPSRALAFRLVHHWY